jgi:hypothetical protein
VTFLFVMLPLALCLAGGRLAAQTGPEVPAVPAPQAAQQETPAPPSDIQALVLIERARLAASGRYYLQLDLSVPSISICHSGVAIATYPIQSLAVGYPRIFLVPEKGSENWIGEAWTLGHLEPAKVFQRVKVVPGGAETATPDYLPPTIEELIAVPPVYSIQFDNRRAVRVILDGKIPATTMEISPWRERWEDFLEGLGAREADAIRIRIHLQGADGASLFRSFPDDPPELLIVP